MKALVLGATGYTGVVLVRLLALHPSIHRVTAVSTSRSSQSVRANDPGLFQGECVDDRYLSIEEAYAESFDVVFSALPHGASARLCEPFLGRTVIIDLSADFRYTSAERFERAYGTPPPLPATQESAVYGLCEWYREAIRTADTIANPGCYPTATLLPLLPLAHGGFLTGPVAVHAMSGISGAGRKERVDLLYAERTENANAYNPGTTHRHASEIEEQLQAAGTTHTVLFTPHLVPIKQGMAVTATVPVSDPDSAAEAIVARYAQEPWVDAAIDVRPETRHVRATNRARIGIHREEGHLILMSVIDNVWKGASGQAIQNMNIRFGLGETTGLLQPGEL